MLLRNFVSYPSCFGNDVLFEPVGRYSRQGDSLTAPMEHTRLEDLGRLGELKQLLYACKGHKHQQTSRTSREQLAFHANRKISHAADDERQDELHFSAGCPSQACRAMTNSLSAKLRNLAAKTRQNARVNTSIEHSHATCMGMQPYAVRVHDRWSTPYCGARIECLSQRVGQIQRACEGDRIVMVGIDVIAYRHVDGQTYVIHTYLYTHQRQGSATEVGDERRRHEGSSNLWLCACHHCISNVAFTKVRQHVVDLALQTARSYLYGVQTKNMIMSTSISAPGRIFSRHCSYAALMGQLAESPKACQQTRSN